jgi:hypothetical protein
MMEEFQLTSTLPFQCLDYNNPCLFIVVREKTKTRLCNNIEVLGSLSIIHYGNSDLKGQKGPYAC